jgi:hypothetical protein
MNNLNKLTHQKTSGSAGTFCVRCHSPMSVILGEDPNTPVDLRNTVSIEGITCIVCHRQDKNHGTGRGEVVVHPGTIDEKPLFGPFPGSDQDPEKGIKQVQIGREGKLTHKAVGFQNIRESQFCGQCHDVPVPNGYRLEDLFGEWRNSPAAREGTTCQDCHMGILQGVKSPRATGQIAVVQGLTFPERTLSDHTFAGPDYSVVDIDQFPLRRFEWPVLMDDPNFDNWIAGVRKKLGEGAKLTPLDERKYKKYQTLVAKSEELLEMAKRKRVELLKNAAVMTVNVPETIGRGDKLPIAVTIENKISGHAFPAGFNTERQVWLAVTVKDDKGEVVYQSGDLDSNGDLRDEKSLDVLSGKLPFDYDLFNLQSKFKLKTVAGTERSDHFFFPRDVDNFMLVRPMNMPTAPFNGPFPVRTQKNGIPPLDSRTANYKAATGESRYYDVSVKFNFRNFAPIVMIQLDADALIPKLQIVELDSRDVRVKVVDK